MARSWLTLAEPRRRLAPLSAAGRGGGPGRAPAGLAAERRAAGPAAHGRLRQRRRVRPAAGAASTWGRDPLLRRLRALAEGRDRTRDRPPASRPGVMTGPALSPALSTSIHRAVEPSWLVPGPTWTTFACNHWVVGCISSVVLLASFHVAVETEVATGGRSQSAPTASSRGPSNVIAAYLVKGRFWSNLAGGGQRLRPAPSFRNDLLQRRCVRPG